METYAGYSENADWNVGRVLDAIEEMGELDNTLVIWIWGDNGASMEGTLSGTFNELTTLNGIPLTTEQQMGLLFKHGGLEAWGGDLVAPHYAAAWAWASNCPFDWGKQVASHLGGTRDPLVVRYPTRIADPGALRSHFTHVIDIAPTVLEIAGHPGPDARRRDRAGAAARVHVRRLALRRRRARAAHAAVLRGRRQPGDVQGRLVARDAPAAHPLVARPRGAAPLRARLGPRRRPGRALLPARRLRAGEEPRRRAPGEGRGAPQALLGGGGALPGAADPRRALVLLRDRAARSPRSRSSRTAGGSRTSRPG